jgi:FkbH-like protein
MPTTDLYWLPRIPDFRQQLSSLSDTMPADGDGPFWPSAIQLANHCLDFVQTAKLDRLLQRLSVAAPAPAVRLAVLGSATTSHLLPGIRIGALRRNMFCEIYECGHNQYIQELHQRDSALHSFHPDAILFSFDARHLTSGSRSVEQTLETITACWKRAREFCSHVIQQTILPVFPPLLGQNEHRLPSSPGAAVARINASLRPLADEFGVHLLAVDDWAARGGIDTWHSVALWHRAKQEITPGVSPLYGDLAARLLAALNGRSAKCLVLDLDNTLWGGVIGDDGLGGIELGQGSAVGEAHLSVQQYALKLADRGVILAVCSKNDEATALLPFERHSEMILKRSDIACFAANWKDKAANLREIARALSIGVDSLVLLDDSPHEREQVRRELPEVTVLELPEDPALYPACIADSGCFEAAGITAEDFRRTALYQSNLDREVLRESASDLPGYLRSLGMVLRHSPFDGMGLKRIAQLINKTNQFNLSTKRYTEQDVERFIGNEDYLTWQVRLLDRFGDNGIVGVVIARISTGISTGINPGINPGTGSLVLDTWLMSCRVLGRNVEHATLALMARAARDLGLTQIRAEYIPSGKNEMLRGILPALGFENSSENGVSTLWKLDLESYIQPEVFVDFAEGVHAGI